MKVTLIPEVMEMAKVAREQGRVFNPMFIGPPGLGKSELIEQWCKNNKYQFINLRLALLEAPDLIGFPSIENKDGRQVTVNNTPEFWPVDGKGVIFLDEINRANTSVMNAVLQATDSSRRIGKYVIPEGWIIASAVNPETTDYDVNTMDPALKDRFVPFNVTYDKASFVSFMKKSNWNKSIIAFVDSNTWSYKAPEEIGNVAGNKYIAPRTFSHLNAALCASENMGQAWSTIEKDTYFSILGNNVGRSFLTFLHDEFPITFKDLQTNEKRSLKKLKEYSDPKKLKAAHISLTIEDLKLNEKELENELLVNVCLTIPADMAVVLLREISYARNENIDTLMGKLTKIDKSLTEIFQKN